MRLRPGRALSGEKASRNGHLTALAPSRDGVAASHERPRDRAMVGHIWQREGKIEGKPTLRRGSARHGVAGVGSRCYQGCASRRWGGASGSGLSAGLASGAGPLLAGPGPRGSTG
jgi:hypothetical protein